MYTYLCIDILGYQFWLNEKQQTIHSAFFVDTKLACGCISDSFPSIFVHNIGQRPAWSAFKSYQFQSSSVANFPPISIFLCVCVCVRAYYVKTRNIIHDDGSLYEFIETRVSVNWRRNEAVHWRLDTIFPHLIVLLQIYQLFCSIRQVYSLAV